ncbi:hypothetical protein SDC9_190109 [bioreactor metagenome]|uniref:Uncharacterized protein n=1 Tax=bioreactor metagenome TaxID=1076179 RepID=A0A645HVR2_9ZZZZ
MLAQTTKCATDRRLTEIELLRCPSHAALGQQGIQRDQQVEIQTVETHALPLQYIDWINVYQKNIQLFKILNRS